MNTAKPQSVNTFSASHGRRHSYAASWLMALIFVAALTPLAGLGKTTSDDGIWSTTGHVKEPEKRAGPRKYATYVVDEQRLRERLAVAPAESAQHQSNVVIAVPMPDGSFQRIALEYSPIFSAELQAQYPDMRTYRGVGVDDPSMQGRLDLTPAGFHAMLFTDDGVVFIDPAKRGDTHKYMSYWKSDVVGEGFVCDVDGTDAHTNEEWLRKLFPANNPSGTQLRTYRLAVSVTGEYTQFFGGTAGAAAQITTTVNRVTGIFERDVAIRLNLVATRIFTDPNTDPFPQASCDLRTENQTELDTNVGNANYDIGHVFSSGPGGGIATLGSVCVAGSKARGCTSTGNPSGDAFDVDFVAHEIGHQFGASHTWSGDTCAAADQFDSGAAYEPGSGTTVMGYAGVCGAAQNIQAHSDPFFHTRSFDQIVAFRTTGAGNTCGTSSATGNNAPTVEAGPDCAIPQSTPFTLTAQGSEPDNDSMTFLWEQFDAAGAMVSGTPSATATSGPLFRSYPATTSPSRTFPRFQDILSGATTTWEVLPAVDRTLHFRVTARDNRVAGGGSDWDSMQVTVSGSPFQVVAPAQGAQLECGDTANITWNVGGGSIAPNVNVQMSTDGGSSFSTLVSNTANDGSEQITVPKVLTSTGRVMLTPTSQCFFAVSKSFSIADTKAPTVTAPAPAVAECTSPSGTPVNIGTASATDLCDASVTITNNAPSVYPLGMTTVTWTGTDDSTNHGTATQSVTVQDTTKPIVQMSLAQTMLWSPNHDLTNVGLTASVSDVCDPHPNVTVSVFGDEDDLGPPGDGNFSPDAKALALNTLRLRNERNGSGDGRVYLIIVKATDGSNNTGFDCGTVAVAHDASAPSVASVNAQAAGAKSFCLANNGTAPAGYFVVGDGPVVGPKQ